MKQKNFTTYAWTVLIYTLGVILWGAYVRATGSGAGCGSHWPLCDGAIIPRAEQIETVIEYTHRLTSALSGLLVLIMFIWALRLFPKGHMARHGSGWSLFFMITEGAVGAGLVLFELVAYNTSATRAIMAAVHLVNTFLLVAYLTLTIWWASGGQRLQWRGQGNVSWLLGIGFIAMLVLGASGAVTALGDTLFPSETLAEGLQQDFSATAHFLVRLRVWHPLIAVATGVYLIFASSVINGARHDKQTARYTRLLKILFLVQLGAGTINVLLLAPVWMQLVHLLLADLVWIVMVFLAAAVLAQPATATNKTPLSPQVTTGD